MLQSLPLSSSSTLVVDSHDLHCSRSSSSSSSRGGVNSKISCCSSSLRNYGSIPKLDSFGRSKLWERVLKDPPLIERSQNKLADYCCTLDGDECYNCWRAYFDLKDLEKVAPKEVVERLIIQAGAVEYLIGNVHGIAEMYKAKKGCSSKSEKTSDVEQAKVRLCPIPDGLPKSREELEEEEKWKMPDSPFTRLLRVMGRNSSKYSPVPDY